MHNNTNPTYFSHKATVTKWNNTQDKNTGIP